MNGNGRFDEVEILALQRFLNTSPDIDIEEDGLFGSETETAFHRALAKFIDPPGDIAPQDDLIERLLAVRLTPEAHRKRSDVPYLPNRIPANVRYNNPAAAYPRQRDNLYALAGYGVIGGGHLIGRFPTPVHGAAANMDLFSLGYRGMNFRDAVRKWRGGNGSLHVPAGFDPTATVDLEFLQSRERMTDFFEKMASHESSRFKMDHRRWLLAFDMYLAGGHEPWRHTVSTTA